MIKNNFVFFNFWRWDRTFCLRGSDWVYVRLRSARQGVFFIIGCARPSPTMSLWFSMYNVLICVLCTYMCAKMLHFVFFLKFLSMIMWYSHQDGVSALVCLSELITRFQLKSTHPKLSALYKSDILHFSKPRLEGENSSLSAQLDQLYNKYGLHTRWFSNKM